MNILRLNLRILSLRSFFFLCLFASHIAFAKLDDKAGLPRAGNPLPGLTAGELAYFNAGKVAFLEKNSVTGNEPNAPNPGLGPRFNLNSCGGCHAQPATGGSTPSVNPQIAVASKFGARNIIPPFISINGPVREARFKFDPTNMTIRDGGVQNLFVITGRRDAPNCRISQPDFERAIATNNIIFRIPTPVFGAGLIESIPDSLILSNTLTNLEMKKFLGIKGHVNRESGIANRSGNDGTITRFGWKAQNKSLTIFAGEAYNVEQGITNELFPNKRDESLGCVLNPLPESTFNCDAVLALKGISHVNLFAQFMRFLAPPTPKPLTPTGQHGLMLFSTVGCALCHTPALQTGESSTAALSHRMAELYSDLLVHNMGPGLADNIIQGNAGPDEFRTAPLWGLGQRLFFLHDGRTNDLQTAIIAHSSTNAACLPGQDTTPDGIHCQSEANAVIQNYLNLSASDKAALQEFLTSL